MRLFIGIPVSLTVREKLEAAWKDVGEKPTQCRFIEPEKWHFTLAFLGEVSEEVIESLVPLIEKAIVKPPLGGFTFKDFRTFPNRRAAYVVANMIAAPSNEWIAYIERLRDMVSVIATNIDRKPWVPHVTIARAKRGHVLPPWSHSIGFFDWQPASLALIQSKTDQNGSTYTHVHEFPFNI